MQIRCDTPEQLQFQMTQLREDRVVRIVDTHGIFFIEEPTGYLNRGEKIHFSGYVRNFKADEKQPA